MHTKLESRYVQTKHLCPFVILISYMLVLQIFHLLYTVVRVDLKHVVCGRTSGREEVLGTSSLTRGKSGNFASKAMKGRIVTGKSGSIWAWAQLVLEVGQAQGGFC
jgi:hypothetical protein